MNALSIPVLVQDQSVGDLITNADDGTLDFRYHPDTPPALAVSLTMPVEAPPSDYQGFLGLPPPFEVHLPEGAVLESLRRRYHKLVDLDDDLALLRLTGQHGGGRVTYGGPYISDPLLDAKIMEAVRKPESHESLCDLFQKGDHVSAAGLSGIMPKMSAADRGAHRPGAWRGEHVIVKFDGQDYPGSSAVEYVCLNVCRAAGLDVPAVTLSADAKAISITRFDRKADGSRIGFEDACALTGLHRHGKYRGTTEDLARMIDHFVPSDEQASAKKDLFARLIVNDLLRNGDAHLKNIGMTYENPNRPRLAPVYDVLTTTVWLPKDLPALALRPGGAPAWMTERSLLETGRTMGVRPQAARQLYRAMRETVISATESIARSLPAADDRTGEAVARLVRIVRSTPDILASARPMPLT